MTRPLASPLTLLILCVPLSGTTRANDIDPSDLTQVNSFISGAVDDDGKLTVMGGAAGQYADGNNFLGLVEHGAASRRGEDGRRPQDSRLRYFQVFDVDSASLPQIGFSVDYMKSWKMSSSHDASIGSDIVALGAIAKVQVGESLSVFPNVAYVAGQADFGTVSSKLDLNGYQLNLFGSLALGDNGQYLVLQPQYMSLDADPRGRASASGQVQLFKVKTGYGLPISRTGRWWLELSHTYTRTDADARHLGNHFGQVDNDHSFEIALSYYL